MKLGRVMRIIHLCASLYLVPWLLVYALSAFVLNHGQWFRSHMEATSEFTIVDERDFAPGSAFPREPAAQAQAILGVLDLDGPHHIRGRPMPHRMVIMRPSAGGPYRITWLRRRSKIIVERMAFSPVRMLTSLHFQHGYRLPYPVPTVWAVMVDLFATSALLWVITGIYMWATTKARRRMGAVSLVAGCVVFAVLVVALLQ